MTASSNADERSEHKQPDVGQDDAVQESEVRPDAPMTRQQDDDSAIRHRYADARASDYSHDFQSDGSGSHPVKPASDDRMDDDGIPDIAQKQPPKKDETR